MCVNNFINLDLGISQGNLLHFPNGTIYCIHNVFVPKVDGDDDFILEKGRWKTFYSEKSIFGFDFDGTHKTMWMEEEKQSFLIQTLNQWNSQAHRRTGGKPLHDLKSIFEKLFNVLVALHATKSPYDRASS